MKWSTRQSYNLTTIFVQLFIAAALWLCCVLIIILCLWINLLDEIRSSFLVQGPFPAVGQSLLVHPALDWRQPARRSRYVTVDGGGIGERDELTRAELVGDAQTIYKHFCPLANSNIFALGLRRLRAFHIHICILYRNEEWWKLSRKDNIMIRNIIQFFAYPRMAYSIVGWLVAMLVASKNIHHPS